MGAIQALTGQKNLPGARRFELHQARNRLFAAITLLGLLAACSSGVPAASPTATLTAGQASSSPSEISVSVYFSSQGKLVPETRLVAAADPARSTLAALMTGPKAAGHFTELPDGTKLLDVSVKDQTAAVNFSHEFFSSGGSTGLELRLGQVVYTLTQFPDIRNVQFLDEGAIRAALGGEGLPIGKPLSPQDLRGISVG